MRLLWSYIKNYKRYLVLAIVLATINQVFSLADPQIIGMLLDQYAANSGNLTSDLFLRGVLTLLLAWVGVAFISRLAKTFQSYYTSLITEKLGAALYQKGVQHSLDLPYSVFEDETSGKRLEQLKKAKTDAQTIISLGIENVYLPSITLLIVFVYSFYVHWIIGLVYFITAPIIGFTSYTLGKKIKSIQTSIFQETNELAGNTVETLRNIELVKSLGLSEQEIKRLNGVTDQILQLELKKVRYMRMFNFVQGTLVNFLRALLIFILLMLVFYKAISLGNMLTLMFYSFFVFNPIFEMGNLFIKYREAESSLNKFEEILQLPSEQKPSHPKEIQKLEEIRFENVSFQHKTAATPAINDVSFSLKKGESVAIVGPSGSGKSTLMKLILGLYRTEQGKILFNDIPVSDIDYDAFRNKIGFVSQETQLFAGTIRENLLFVKPDATEAQLQKVLEQASCSNILARAEQGIDSKIGEGGIKISGGEKQRLAIARALLREPELLIFDEATSSLDSLTEKEITDTLKSISERNKDRIIITIAHRLSTIIHVDQIYVLGKGKIIETGTHEKLLETKGLYYALWRQQIGE